MQQEIKDQEEALLKEQKSENLGVDIESLLKDHLKKFSKF